MLGGGGNPLKIEVKNQFWTFYCANNNFSIFPIIFSPHKRPQFWKRFRKCKKEQEFFLGSPLTPPTSCGLVGKVIFFKSPHNRIFYAPIFAEIRFISGAKQLRKETEFHLCSDFSKRSAQNLQKTCNPQKWKMPKFKRLEKDCQNWNAETPWGLEIVHGGKAIDKSDCRSFLLKRRRKKTAKTKVVDPNKIEAECSEQ